MGKIIDKCDKNSEARSESFILRFTPSEKAALLKNASESGQTLSNYIRLSVFGGRQNTAQPKENSSKNFAPAVKSLASSHRKIAGEYARVTSLFAGSYTSLPKGTTCSSNFIALTRLFTTLVDNTMDMQAELNKVLAIIGGKDLHLYAKPMGFSQIEQDLSSTKESRERENIRLENLEFVVLTGKIASDVNLFSDTGNEMLVKFTFLVDDFFKEKTTAEYEVIGRSEGLVPSEMRNGDTLVVTGLLRRDEEDGRRIIKAQSIILTKDNMQTIVLVGKIAKDAETLTRKDGTQKMAFTLRVDDFFKGEKTTATYDVCADKTNVITFLKKGRTIIVVGRLHKDRESGLDVVFADNIELLPDRR